MGVQNGRQKQFGGTQLKLTNFLCGLQLCTKFQKEQSLLVDTAALESYCLTSVIKHRLLLWRINDFQGHVCPLLLLVIYEHIQNKIHAYTAVWSDAKLNYRKIVSVGDTNELILKSQPGFLLYSTAMWWFTRVLTKLHRKHSFEVASGSKVVPFPIRVKSEVKQSYTFALFYLSGAHLSLFPQNSYYR